MSGHINKQKLLFKYYISPLLENCHLPQYDKGREVIKIKTNKNKRKKHIQLSIQNILFHSKQSFKFSEPIISIQRKQKMQKAVPRVRTLELPELP